MYPYYILYSNYIAIAIAILARYDNNGLACGYKICSKAAKSTFLTLKATFPILKGKTVVFIFSLLAGFQY